MKEISTQSDIKTRVFPVDPDSMGPVVLTISDRALYMPLDHCSYCNETMGAVPMLYQQAAMIEILVNNQNYVLTVCNRCLPGGCAEEHSNPITMHIVQYLIELIVPGHQVEHSGITDDDGNADMNPGVILQ